MAGRKMAERFGAGKSRASRLGAGQTYGRLITSARLYPAGRAAIYPYQLALASGRAQVVVLTLFQLAGLSFV